MAHYGLKLWNWRIQFHWLKSLSHELQSERTSERSEQFGASEWVRANERTEEHMRSIWMRLRNKKRTLISGMTNDYCANPDPGRSNQLAGSQACFLVAHSLAKTPVFHLHRLMHQIYASLIPNPDPAHASVIFSVSWFPWIPKRNQWIRTKHKMRFFLRNPAPWNFQTRGNCGEKAIEQR